MFKTQMLTNDPNGILLGAFAFSMKNDHLGSLVRCIDNLQKLTDNSFQETDQTRIVLSENDFDSTGYEHEIMVNIQVRRMSAWKTAHKFCIINNGNDGWRVVKAKKPGKHGPN